MYDTDDIEQQMRDRARILTALFVFILLVTLVLIAIPVALIIWLRSFL